MSRLEQLKNAIMLRGRFVLEVKNYKVILEYSRNEETKGLNAEQLYELIKEDLKKQMVDR